MDVPRRRNCTRKGAELSEESGFSEGKQERNSMDINNGEVQKPSDLFISDDGLKELTVINRLFGINIVNHNLIAALKLLLRKELSYYEIIKLAFNSNVSRELFVAAFEKDPTKVSNLFIALHECLEEPKKYEIITHDYALYGLAIAVFEVGCMLDTLMKGKDSSYEETIVLPILSLIKIDDGKFNRFFRIGYESAQLSQLSEMIKKYYRAEGDGSGSKRLDRLEQARQISAKVVQFLPDLPKRGTGHVGEYIMSQIAYAVLSPLSPSDKMKAIGLVTGGINPKS